jgi:transposase-like protein
MADIQAPRFTDAEEARKYLESIRWPHGPVCPHCGSTDSAYATKRPGLYRCGSKECRKDFTVTVGTVYERSHIPLNKWLLATYLLCSSKKGISAHQLHRMLDVTYKSAWFMTHRIREAMKPGSGEPPLGGEGKVVEADETFLGHIKGTKRPKAGYHHKHKVVSLVERKGNARSFHITTMYTPEVKPILMENIRQDSTLMTDEGYLYKGIGKEFAKHQTINHSKDYVRGAAHTNTTEGFFSIFKRGMTGIYQHCGEQHLKRYLAEFDFRYSNRSALGVTDDMRTDRALRGSEGKRLTYRHIRNERYLP